MLGSWQDLDRTRLGLVPGDVRAPDGKRGCLWAVQRIALGGGRWPDLIESQLAGNALAKIAPAGGAVGAALQYRMLVEAGHERGRAVAGITAINLLTFAVVLALPVLAVPAFFRGSVDRELLEATLVGVAVFALLLGAGSHCSPSTARWSWSGGPCSRAQPDPPPLASRFAPCPSG